MSTIAAAKLSMVWQSASQRERCGNCAKSTEKNSDPGRATPSLHCISGGFLTSSYAVCDQWEARPCA